MWYCGKVVGMRIPANLDPKVGYVGPAVLAGGGGAGIDMILYWILDGDLGDYAGN